MSEEEGALRNGEVSHWLRSLDAARRTRPRLSGSVSCDVAIVGAGFTGLWTAWHLSRLAPHLTIRVIESEHVGYGASGRNGGWLSHLVPGNRAIYARGPRGMPGAQALQRALVDAVGEVSQALRIAGIDADLVRGGNTVVAQTPAGLERLRARRGADLRYGMGEDEVRWLDADQVPERIHVAGARGGLYYPGVARLDPARLVVGLARAVESAGVRIHEGSRVSEVSGSVGGTAGRTETYARTHHGTVRASAVLLCIEGYGGPLLGNREVIPVNSSMIATRVLTPEEWAGIGWHGRDCLSDAAHTFVYAQRTADDRIAIGGRGRPYRWRSGTGGRGEVAAETIEELTARLGRLFGHLDLRADRDIEHAWSGILGVTRDWCATVRFDRSSGIGAAYGYAGHGVTASFVAARSLVDLVLDRETEAARLPIVGHRSPRWEPEPLRWAGVHGMYRLFRTADRWEEARGAARTSWLARVGGRLAGLSD